MLLTKASPSSSVSPREQKNLEVAYHAACESIVLLKNDGALPFSGKRLAAYGSGVSRTIKGGGGSGEVNERHSVSILEGLETLGFEVSTKSWIDDFELDCEQRLAAFKEEKKFRLDFKNIAASVNKLFQTFAMPCGREICAEDVQMSATDICIYVLSRQAGEGGDRRLEKGDYFLSDEEYKNIKFCAENYKSFVLIINCGSSVDMGFLDEIPGINAILYISQLGMQGGRAVAELLSGNVTPSGKLADTWAKTYSDLPFSNEYSYLNGNLENEYYKEDIYVGYRYFDSFGKEPLYPFGFGLSYTSFEIGSAAVSAQEGRICLTTTVKNTGPVFSGREVLQLYVSAPNGGLSKEYQRLAAFSKSSLLAPGESESINLSFDMASLASFRFDDASYVLEAGDYILRLGNSSRSTVAVAAVRLDREAVISRHEHICPQPLQIAELQSGNYNFDVTGLPVINIDAASFKTVVCRYGEPPVCEDKKVRSFVNKLSVREMADIVVGVGEFDTGRFSLPGSVGNTTSKFWDRGLANIALCDGPAGLRIQKLSTVSDKGKIKPVEFSISLYNSLPAFIRKSMLGNPEKEEPLYQFATAFPVASALAQSWNEKLLYELGQAVFEEMKEYGCTFWLAPAVNIHRNPLCGRNFEYFSEDPLLCGLLAAAMVRGVEQEEGYYVTVKHLACNNQEDNRNKVSSNLSERALREIYLRAFEICVRQGGAKGIMTAYNKVNGVYAPVSHDLCTKLLRNEWGFDGVVMTDWFSTIMETGASALAIKAGNDLIMPGEPLSKIAIISAVKNGSISIIDLRRCCCNVVDAIMKSATEKEYIGL